MIFKALKRQPQATPEPWTPGPLPVPSPGGTAALADARHPRAGLVGAFLNWLV